MFQTLVEPWNEIYGLHSAEEVTAILQVADTENSGFLSVTQLVRAMKNDRFEHAFRTLGIDIRMPEHYFKTLASVTQQDELSIDEFVAHIVQMKGAVSRTDVQTLTLETALLQKLAKKYVSRSTAQVTQVCVDAKCSCVFVVLPCFATVQ